jgi:acyl carrier protein
MTPDFNEPLRLALAELLENDPGQVTADANFAELGMDSLVALRFARKVKDLTGIEIELESLFDYPSVAELSTFLAGRAEVQA